MPSVWIAWAAIPDNKATSVGVALAGYNTAPIIYGALFTLLSNPSEIQAVAEDDSGLTYFPAEVTERVPGTIRYFAVILGISGIIGCFCLRSKNIKAKATKNSSTMTTWEMIKNWKAWYLFSMTFFMFGFTFYLLNTYKDIAMKYISDDYFLAMVGALSFVVGTFGRFFYGRMLDLYDWKKVMASALVLQIICAGIMEFSFINKYFFATVFIVASFAGTAMFIGSMMISDSTFPNDRWIFSYISLAMILDMILIYVVRGYFVVVAGEFYSFYLMMILLIIGLLQVIFQFDTQVYQKLV